MNRLIKLFSLALREGRGSKRRLLLYMSSIVFGVAALVSIDSFASNVTRSVEDQSKELLGGDLQIRARQPFTDAVNRTIDSLMTLGVEVAHSTTMASMVSNIDHSKTKLVNLVAIDKRFPFYGSIETEPDSTFKLLQSENSVAVDSTLLRNLGLNIGDSLRVGNTVAVISGTLRPKNALTGFANALGPRVYLSIATLNAAELLQFGTTAEHSILLKVPANISAGSLADAIKPQIEKENARVQAVSQSQRATERSLGTLTQFIGVIGLLALLLGGVGVASGTTAYISEKRNTISVLRCLGATYLQILIIYITQTVGIALVAALLGATVGIAIQLALPQLAANIVPVDISFELSWMALLQGIVLGAWTALIFALRPILEIKNISPLAAIRADYEISKRYKLSISATILFLLISCTVVGVSIYRAGSIKRGLAFAAGIGVAALALYLISLLLIRTTKLFRSAGFRYTVKQGLANLYRPNNHTRSIILSLGFGAFLLSTLYLTQHNILKSISVVDQEAAGNLIFFDIQPDQLDGFKSIVNIELIQTTPVVSMRISSINSKPISSYIQDTTAANRWAFRREYRSTYRDSLQGGETITSGRWFSSTRNNTSTQTSSPLTRQEIPPGEVSLESGIAKDLGVKLGDTIVWDVQGIPVTTSVTSLREVVWNRFEPNFFAVFTPYSLENAPQQYVAVARTSSSEATASLQATVAERLPNISSVDISSIRSAIEDMMNKVSSAILGLAMFAFVTGIPVIVTAISSTRRERVREAILLKTLGASRRQVRSILTTEYTILGIIGGTAGVLLSTVAAWGLLTYVFNMQFEIPAVHLLFVVIIAIGISLTTGLLATRSVYRANKEP